MIVAKHVKVYESVLKNLPRGLRVWVPMTLLIEEESGKKRATYIYCSLYTFFKNSGWVRVLSSFREIFPGFEYGEPVRAAILPVEKCSREDFTDSLDRLLNDIQPRGGPDLRALPSLRLAISHLLSPVKWVLGDTKRVEEGIATQIALRIIEEVRSELFRAMNVGLWEEGYVLHVLDLNVGSVYYVVGNKVVKNSVLSKALREDRVAREAIGSISA